MKKISIISLLLILFIPFAFSQYEGHGRFIKRIEYNVQGETKRIFFGDFNAPVEFTYLPSSTAALNKELISGFRIVRDSTNILEIKYISNYKEADEEVKRKYPVKGRNLTTIHNKTALAKQHEEMSKLFKIETVSFPVSDQLAENLHKKMVWLIDNFEADKSLPPLMTGGYSVEFRVVIDYELWSLIIDMPQGNVLKMSDLCRQIITDAITDKMDMKQYIKILDDIL